MGIVQSNENCNNNNNTSQTTDELTTSDNHNFNQLNTTGLTTTETKIIVNNLNNDKKEISEILDENEEEEEEEEFNKNNKTIIVMDKKQTMDEFKEELKIKREKRQNAVAAVKNEINNLRELLTNEKKLNKLLIEKYEPNLKENEISEILCNKEIDDDGGGGGNDDDGGGGDGDDDGGGGNDDGVGGNDDDSTSTNNCVNKTSESDDDNLDDDKGCCSKKFYNNNNGKSQRNEIAEIQLALQLANTEILTLTNELDVTRKHVRSLKEVIVVSKKMVEIREEQVAQLKTKLEEIEESMAERELKLMSDDLRKEYDRQLENIKNLKLLYEERARVSTIERDNIRRELQTTKSELDAEIEKNKNLNELILELQDDLKKTSNNLTETDTKLSASNSRTKQLESEMSTINELSSQILMGFNAGNVIDIDKLTEVLEENRGLLRDITVDEVSAEGASVLPKLLFDLCVQADSNNQDNNDNDDEDNDNNNDDKIKNDKKQFATAQEIVGNLPKVWRVLMEFLSHHKVKKVQFDNTNDIGNDGSSSSCSGSITNNNGSNGSNGDCYKSIQTPAGPELVISVSKTFIKLKDLILEKKSLQKETTRLKTLNEHLDKRLQTQEKRLSVVSVELTKTWHLVGRMQRQHRQLHTHEQILRYQLQQKRRMLNELKEELEYCRKKWAMAKQKNNDTEIQWKLLQCEFANRKIQDSSSSYCNSGESGYSDADDDNEKSENSDDDIEKKKLIKTKVIWRRVSSLSPERKIQSVDNNGVFSRGQSEPIELYRTVVKEIIQERLETDEELLIGTTTPTAIVKTAATTTAVTTINQRREYFLAGSIELAKPKVMMTATVTQQPQIITEQKQQQQKRSSTTQLNKVETIEEMFLRLNSLSLGPSTSSTILPEPQNQTTVEEEEKPSTSSESVSLMEPTPTIMTPSPPLSLPSTSSELISPLQIQLISLMEPTPSTSSMNLPPSHPLPSTSFELSTPLSQKNQSISSLEPIPSTSTMSAPPPPPLPPAPAQIATTSKTSLLTLTEEEYTARRAARLKRLEEQCQQLLSNATNRVYRGDAMSSQLDLLHGRYGGGGSGSNNRSRSNTIDETELENDNTTTNLNDNLQIITTTIITSPTTNNESVVTENQTDDEGDNQIIRQTPDEQIENVEELEQEVNEEN